MVLGKRDGAGKSTEEKNRGKGKGEGREGHCYACTKSETKGREGSGGKSRVEKGPWKGRQDSEFLYKGGGLKPGKVTRVGLKGLGAG